MSEAREREFRSTGATVLISAFAAAAAVSIVFGALLFLLRMPPTRVNQSVALFVAALFALWLAGIAIVGTAVRLLSAALNVRINVPLRAGAIAAAITAVAALALVAEWAINGFD